MMSQMAPAIQDMAAVTDPYRAAKALVPWALMNFPQVPALIGGGAIVGARHAYKSHKPNWLQQAAKLRRTVPGMGSSKVLAPAMARLRDKLTQLKSTVIGGAEGAGLGTAIAVNDPTTPLRVISGRGISHMGPNDDIGSIADNYNALFHGAGKYMDFNQ